VTLRIAVVQTHDAALEVAAAVALTLRHLEEAREAGAALVLFPELSLGGYSLGQDMVRRAGAAEAALARLQPAVDVTGVSAVVGLPLQRRGGLFNATAILRPDSEPDLYFKTHLFRSERDWFTPGAALWTGSIAGWPCGIMVCYELGFPEIARRLALDGARLLLVPAAFGRARTHIWETACAARAMENGVFLAAAGQAGTNGVLHFAGRSKVVDPTGVEMVAAGVDGDTMLFADLDPGLVDEVRAGKRDDANPYLSDRRPELYAE
jgi:omega-amidase